VERVLNQREARPKKQKRSELFSREELAQLQRTHKDGITSAQLVTLLGEREVKFSEATLRKYVQLGLLPRSRRVGRVGQRRGSVGMYPPSIIAQIAAIKSGLKGNLTLEAMRSRSGMIADLEVLAAAFARLRTAMKEQDKKSRPGRELEEEWKALEKEFFDLHQRLQTQIQAQLHGASEESRESPPREETGNG
jgi:hypothetical protein